MAYQVEGSGGTAMPPSKEFMEWLKKNKLHNQQLIELLTEEEIESVDDLLVLKNSLGEEKKFTEILVNKGIKMGKISKLLKALNNYNPQSNDNQNLSGSILMLDKHEKEAIQLLSSKLFEIESKLKSLPQYSKKLTASKESVKEKINNMCKEWKKLVDLHQEALYKWIESVEKREVEQNKLLNKKLNDELHLVQQAKSKCQSLMSFASIEDIWAPKQASKNQQQSQETVVSLVSNCVDKLDKSLVIPKTNIFDQLAVTQFEEKTTQEILAQNINASLPKESKLLVDIDNKTQIIQFTVQTDSQFDLYSLRELFVKTADNKSDINIDDEKDEKKDDINTITKLKIIDNKCSISVKELDNKLPEHQYYSAYIVEYLGTVAMKRDAVQFQISRMPPFELDKNKQCYKIESKKAGEYTIHHIGKSDNLFGNISLKETQQWKWEIYMDHFPDSNNPDTNIGIDCINNTTYPGQSAANSYGINADKRRIYFYANSKKVKELSVGISTGYVIEMYFNGPKREFSISGNGKLLYTFNDVKSNKVMYPCLKPWYKTTIFTIRNFRRVN